MYRFRNAALGAAATLLIVQALLFTAPGQALAGAISEVLVTNTVANPVPVRDIVDGRQPKTVEANCAMAESYVNCFAIIDTSDIPQGKRFVVEFVTVTIVTPGGQAPIRTSLMAENLAGRGTFYLPVSWQGDYNGSSNYTGSAMTRLYVDPGSRFLVFGIYRNGSTGRAQGSITLSGYLVDVS